MLKHIQLFLGILFLLALIPGQARGDHCGTELISHEDFLDPSGYPRERQNFEPLDLNRSVVLLSYDSSVTPTDLPKLPDDFPASWSAGVTIATEKMILYSNELAMNTFLVVRFSRPIELCIFLRGWDEWEKKIAGTVGPFKDAYLIFNRNRKPEVLADLITVWLNRGVGQDVFLKEVVTPFNTNLFTSLHDFSFVPDGKEGLKFMGRARKGGFPLRVALRLAGYIGAKDAIKNKTLITMVRPSFIPLLSVVRTETWIEQILPSGKRWRFGDNELVSVGTFYYPGFTFNLAVDILKNKSGELSAKLILDPIELEAVFKKGFDPKLDDGDLKIVGTGCDSKPAPVSDQRYERQLFTCIFIMHSKGEYKIQKLPLKIEQGSKEFKIANERDLLLMVYDLRNALTGVIDFLPPIEKEKIVVEVRPSIIPVPTPVEREKRTLLGAFDEHMDRKVQEKKSLLYSFFIDVYDHPMEILRANRASVLKMLFISLVVIFLLLITFWKMPLGRRLRVPSLWSLFSLLFIFMLKFIRAVLFLSPLFSYQRRWVTLVELAAGSSNLFSSVLAQRWGILIPADPRQFFEWVVDVNRNCLERAIGALWLEEHFGQWTVLYPEQLWSARRTLFKFTFGWRLPVYFFKLCREARLRER